MLKNKRLNIPVDYSVQPFDEDRFLKMRVKVMHSGLNLNSTNFSKEAIEKAQPTLANIPLLAFVKKNDGEESEDFAGHEFEIKITENDIKYVYLGRPIGIVPETNNYSVEEDEDGKIFVYTDAYVWKDYANSALDIIERDGVKSVSMEINVDEYEGKEEYFDITGYKYTGIALLGEDVNPAMIGAQAEVANYSVVKTSLSEMMAELKEYFAKEEPAEDNEVVEENSEVAEEEKETVEENNEAVEENSEVADEDSEVVEENNEVIEENSQVANDETEQSTQENFEEKYTELLDKFSKLEDSYNTLIQEVEGLRAFKQNIEKEERESALSNLKEEFSHLEEEFTKELFESDKTIQEIETLLLAEEARQMRAKGSQKYTFNSGIDNSNDSKLDGPIWASLVKNK